MYERGLTKSPPQYAVWMKAPATIEPASLVLEPIERETLRRLKAEWEAALARAEVARVRLEHALILAGRARALDGPLTIDFDRGLIRLP